MTTRNEEDKETPKCPLLPDATKEAASPRPKHRSRDAVKHVNEKTEKDENGDEDSEAEKLSPLLQNSDVRGGSLALNMVDVVEPIDDTDTDHEEVASRPASDKNKTYNSK